MTDEDAYNEAMEVFDDMYREQVYVEQEGHWLIVEFDGHMLHVNLWTGKIVVEDDNAETVHEVGGRH